MTTQHTPAPWNLSPDCWVTDSDGDIIATISTAGNMTGKNMFAQARANASLIAQAPNMLSALKGCRDALQRIPEGIIGNHDHDINRQLARVNKIIEDITGGK